MDWTCPGCGYSCYGKHARCPSCQTVRPSLLAPPVPQDLRHKDWTCPECSHGCHGRFAACPSCDTIRPELRSISAPWDKSNVVFASLNLKNKKANWQCSSCHHTCSKGDTKCPKCGDARPDRSSASPKLREKPQKSDKLRKLSRSVLSDWGEVLHSAGKEAVLKEETPKEEISKEDEKALLRAQNRADLENEASKTELKTDEDSQAEKASKRRESRKQRESQLEDEEFDEEKEERRRRKEERKRLKKERARLKEQRQAEKLSAPSPLYLPEFISVNNLADVIGVRPAQFVRQMEDMGFEGVTYDHILDAETAGLIAAEFNFEPIFDTGIDDLTAAPEPEDKSALPPRPPVVTIMGHVDHGKTTILDWLRKSSIAASEHGGITQHIGAFSVAMPSGKVITFLDTPGHSAFLEMRRRGADVTDIVVLVVAADDSVKPQTIEAIKHATEAKVPIVVAISKIDKEGVHPEKVKQDLAVHGVNVEDYGGDVQAVCVSGKTGQGMLELEEAIIAQSEMLDHRADDRGSVEGWVLEATTKSHGRVATALIRRGTLRPGDIIVAGTTWARVRTLRNEAGVIVDEATPGMPVEIDGWKEQPLAGTEILEAPTEQKAKDVVEQRLERTETEKLGEDMTAINQARRELLEKRRLEDAADSESPREDEQRTGPKPINFIIKADVSGSAEAVLNSVAAIGNNEVFANIIRSGVGPVSEFDIEHAATADGHIISFNMPIEPGILRIAELDGVKIMDHNIIYKLIDDVKATLSEHLAPNVSHRVVGEAEIGQIFEITVKGRTKTSIAGCKVRNGTVNRSKQVRVLRGQEVIYDGKYFHFLFCRECEYLISNLHCYRRHLFPQERQEGRDRNAQRHGMWHWL